MIGDGRVRRVKRPEVLGGCRRPALTGSRAKEVGMRMIDRRMFPKGSTAAALDPKVGFVPDPGWLGPNLG